MCALRLNPMLLRFYNIKLLLKWKQNQILHCTKSFHGIFFFRSAGVAEILKTGNWLKPLPLGIY